MKKHIFGRKFKRDVDERKALFKGLMSSLILYEKIETTEEKAKAIKGELDKLVTNAKKDGVLARRLLSSKLSPEALEKMIKDIAPRFDKRQGGYTRTVRLGKRFGDDAMMVMLEWTEKARVGEKPMGKDAASVKPKKAVRSSKKQTKAGKEKPAARPVRKTATSKTKRSIKKNG
jgi:large subunit ribosomal protein L17